MKKAEGNPTSATIASVAPLPLVDIGINLTHQPLRKHWRGVVQRAINAKVDTMVLTGTSLKTTVACLDYCKTWHREHPQQASPNLFCTVGVHPHDAKTFKPDTVIEMRKLLTSNPFAVAVGECGLDYNRNFSSKQQQLRAFRKQVKLACELQMPLFVHEREAHDDLTMVLDEVSKEATLPSIVIHCFTGSKAEALEYIRRGYYIGFTGTICKFERGKPLRALLPDLPLDRLMVETDAPFMGFKRKQRHSEPSHVVDVALKLAESTDADFDMVCRTTTQTAREFFGLDKAIKELEASDKSL